MKKFDKKKAMGWFIIIFMSLSVVGYMGGSFFTGATTFQEETYNGYKFYNNSGWQLQYGEKQYYFNYYPSELEYLTIPEVNLYESGKVYLAYQPEDEFSVNLYLQQLGSIFYINNFIPQQACTVEEGCPDIPVIDCEEKTGIILLAGDNGFSKNNNCLVMKAENSQEMQKLTERLIYKLLGVMG